MNNPTRLYAPAKINLFLRVTGKRPDGYHSIHTLFHKIALFDEVTIHQSAGRMRLSCTPSTVPADERNIAYQAAAHFYDSTGIAPGIEIELRKNIPVAAGLGGGSSDAACVLKALNALYGHPCTESELLSLSRKLGADVPFFISPHTTAIGREKGDSLEPLHSSFVRWFVLINPGFPVSTQWVYQHFELTSAENPFMFSAGDVADIEQFLHNDLEIVTASQYPVIRTLKERLISHGAHGALMAGSGPTVFGLFEEQERAQRAYHELGSSIHADWSIYCVRSLGTWT